MKIKVGEKYRIAVKNPEENDGEGRHGCYYHEDIVEIIGFVTCDDRDVVVNVISDNGTIEPYDFTVRKSELVSLKPTTINPNFSEYLKQEFKIIPQEFKFKQFVNFGTKGGLREFPHIIEKRNKKLDRVYYMVKKPYSKGRKMNKKVALDLISRREFRRSV